MKSANEDRQSDLLFEGYVPDSIGVSARCVIVERDGCRDAMVNGIPVFRYAVGDREAERLFVAQALELGYAQAHELKRVVSCSIRSVHRARRDYVEGGAGALVAGKRGPKGPRLGSQREGAIRRMYASNAPLREIARQVGVSVGTVSNALKRLGLKARGPASSSGHIPGLEPVSGEVTRSATDMPPDRDAEVASPGQSAPSPAAASPRTLDTDPDDRCIDRMLAHRGQLHDAAPLFANRDRVPRAGILLSVPLIVASGVLGAADQTFGTLGPSFYGLRTALMSLLMMALLRIKNAESLKRYAPPDLGHVLGLDRAPEVKTMRRKLSALGDDADKTEAFLRELVCRRVAGREQALGFLYADGHVRVYSGKADLPKAHVAQMRLSVPATQDLWINDADGAPLFFVTLTAHPSLVTALADALPQVRTVVGPGRRVTVVFDRGGWSPDLFARMESDGFDVLTYRKGDVDPVQPEAFTTVMVPGTGGKLSYDLADTEVVVGKKRLRMRQVTRRNGDHQTHIVTTRRDLPAVEIAVRMFNRWRQENFFKYMAQEYAIDALLEHRTEPDDPSRDVPNPARKAANADLAAARREVARLEAAYGAAAMDNPEAVRRTMRGFKIAHGAQLGIPLRKAREQVAALEDGVRALPERVPIGSLRPDVVRLPAARKRLSDGLKMLAYQIETDLARLVAPFYRRADDELRPLVTSALQSAADLRVSPTELHVIIAAQSSPHRTRAVAQLCKLLNDTETCFPGTDLRLRYSVRDSSASAT